MDRLLYRIGPTMRQALTHLAEADRHGHVYPSALALARDVASFSGAALSSARASVSRLVQFGLAERRGRALRLTVAGRSRIEAETNGH